jgi:hypothetical protein
VVIKEIRDKVKKFLESNENENIYENTWGPEKAMLRRTFIATNMYI